MKHQAFFVPTTRRSFLRDQRGFTIIEIMIVVVIVGIVLSLAAANLFPDDAEHLRTESERTFALLENLRDESALGGRTIGFQLVDNQLVLLERDPQSLQPKWLPLPSGLVVVKPFAAGVQATLQVGADVAGGSAAGAVPPGPPATESSADPAADIAVFQPAGVAAPFRLRLATTQNVRTIRSDPLGNLAYVSDAAGP